MSTAKPVLTYFDIPGKAEAIRLTLAAGGVDFEDRRVTFEQWRGGLKQDRAAAPLGKLPTLEVDGRLYTQSNAIGRWAEAKGGLGPRDETARLRADEAQGILEDFAAGIPRHADDAEKKKLREAYVREQVPLFLGLLDRRLAEAGPYVSGTDRLSFADFRVFTLLDLVRAGEWEHVPPLDELVEPYPHVRAHYETVRDLPAVKKFNESRS